MKRISILGSTGSIGINTLNVAENLSDRIQIVGLSTNTNIQLLAEQAEKFNPKIIAIADTTAAKQFRKNYSFDGIVTSGTESLSEVATMAEVDTVVTAVVGAAGIVPTVNAIQAGKHIALANKETLVAAGELVMRLAQKHSVAILPIDSEHSAIQQALHHRKKEEIQRIIVTASGGPFWQFPTEDFENITVEDALNHPTWNMGAKITIDSATMMNKGLEIIEAHHLFGIPLNQLEIAIHPQSIIHSMVEFVDGSMMAQMSVPDMRIPIQYALTYPDHLPAKFVNNDLFEIGNLTFHKPDFQKFPCLELAYLSVEEGGVLPAVLSAVNEKATFAFMDKKIKFTDIPIQIKKVMSLCHNVENPTLDDYLEADGWAREKWTELFG